MLTTTTNRETGKNNNKDRYISSKLSVQGDSHKKENVYKLRYKLYIHMK